MHIYVKDILSALIERHRLKLVLRLTPPDYDSPAEITFHKPSDPEFATHLYLWVDDCACALIRETTTKMVSLRDHVSSAVLSVYKPEDVYKSNAWAEEVLSEVIGKDIHLAGAGREVGFVAGCLSDALAKRGDDFPFRLRVEPAIGNPETAEINFVTKKNSSIASDLSLCVNPGASFLNRATYDSKGEITHFRTEKLYKTEQLHASSAWAAEIIDMLVPKVNSGKPKVIYAAEVQVPDDFNQPYDNGRVAVEDGGRAVILEYTPHREFRGDGKFFFRVHSWDDDATKGVSGFTDENHQLMRSIMGRRVRITVETID